MSLMRWLDQRKLRRRKKGVAAIIGMIFFILIVIIVIAAFLVVFNSFNGYTNTLKQMDQINAQQKATQISITGFSFGSQAQFNGPRNSSLTPVTIGTEASQPLTSISSERKVIYAQNLWWVFYSRGSTTNGIVYETSPDGETWSAATTVTTSQGSQYGYDFAVWLSGNTVYYVLSTAASSSRFYWRYGTLNPSGTITWAISQTAVITSYTTSSYCSIVLDGSGNPWVAVTTKQSSTSYHIEVWKYTAGWAKQYDTGSLTSADETPILVPLTSGVALIYGRGSVTSTLYVTTTATGASWTTATSPSLHFAMFDSSALASGNSVYFAGLGSQSSGASTGAVDFWSFDAVQSSFVKQSTVDGNVSSWQVAISRPGDTLLVFYGSGSNIFQRDTFNQGYSWGSIYTVSQTETNIFGVSSSYSSAALIWTGGSSPTYNVRFAAYSIISVENSSPFATHLISLYIYDQDANTLVHYDTNATGVGVNGGFNYWLAEGETLNIPIALSWATGDTLTATVTSDQGTLSSIVVNSPS